MMNENTGPGRKTHSVMSELYCRSDCYDFSNGSDDSPLEDDQVALCSRFPYEHNNTFGDSPIAERHDLLSSYTTCQPTNGYPQSCRNTIVTSNDDTRRPVYPEESAQGLPVLCACDDKESSAAYLDIPYTNNDFDNTDADLQLDYKKKQYVRQEVWSVDETEDVEANDVAKNRGNQTNAQPDLPFEEQELWRVENTENFDADGVKDITESMEHQMKLQVGKTDMASRKTVCADQTVKKNQDTGDIFVKTLSGSVVRAGFNLTRCGSHFVIINLDPDNDVTSCLQLRENDKLLAINKIDVNCWERHLLEDLIKDIFCPERSHLSLIIERQEWTGEGNYTDTTYEILVDYQLASRGPGSTMGLFTRVVKSTFTPFKAIITVHCEGEITCMIATGSLSQRLYLQCTGDGRLVMSHLPSHQDKRFMFRKVMFHGFRMNNNAYESCFTCVLQSHLLGKYIYVQNYSSVKLLNTSRGADDLASITSIQRPDPRFFVIKKMANNTYVMEFIICKGLYLSWDDDTQKLTTTECKDSSSLETTPCIHFRVVTLSATI